MPLPLHQLGKDGPMVPALGFGLMGMTYDAYGVLPSDEERFKILDRAVELGATFWDTSDLYGDGEELIGKWFKRTGKRDQIFLATKFGYVKGKTYRDIDSSGAYCKKACAESMRLLGVDYIDLYYMHHPNPQTPIEETMRALAELQKEGKIKYIGLSAISSATLRRAVQIAPVTALQTEYSPFNRRIEGADGTDLLATSRELGVGLVLSSPLGRGMLTSIYTNGGVGDEKDRRFKTMPRFLDGNRQHNMKIMAGFTALADKRGCTISQLALAWLLKQGDDIFPIPGTKKMRYLEENCASVEISLSDNDEAEIRAFLDAADIAGDSFPEGLRDVMFRDTVEESS
ncbi:aldo/keto reductase [Xylariomycetidae sp. FL2044]|nr:aldo/keto reductase [Xylariomycetidae sp. FL2044]